MRGASTRQHGCRAVHPAELSLFASEQQRPAADTTPPSRIELDARQSLLHHCSITRLGVVLAYMPLPVWMLSGRLRRLSPGVWTGTIPGGWTVAPVCQFPAPLDGRDSVSFAKTA